MPFLRFSRDKRGYEHTYLVHTATKRGKPSKPRLLYWYRTPPGVKVGRLAFDDEIRRTLEAQYPGIAFDWPAIVATPMPSPEPEYWRERRRVERAAKQARNADDADIDQDEGVAPLPVEAVERVAVAVESIPEAGSEPVGDSSSAPQELSLPTTIADPPTRKRRRRGGRRRRGRPEGQTVKAGEFVDSPGSEDSDSPGPEVGPDPLEPAEE